MIPDLDVVGFTFGMKYADFLGHRRFTHSLVFAAILASLACFIAVGLVEVRSSEATSGYTSFWPLHPTAYWTLSPMVDSESRSSPHSIIPDTSSQRPPSRFLPLAHTSFHPAVSQCSYPKFNGFGCLP